MLNYEFRITNNKLKTNEAIKCIEVSNY